MGSDNNEEKKHPDAGVFIANGMRLKLSNISFTLGPDGDLVDGTLTVSVGLDMCPHWLEIAFDHFVAADEANEQAKLAISASDENAKGEALQREFRAGMQSIVACNVAIDALYANIKDAVEFPPELTETWRKKRTARYKQIAEAVRQAFSLTPAEFESLRKILKEATKFRDWAVHPRAGTAAPVYHPELEISTEWRFVAFRLQNAKELLRMTLLSIQQLLTLTDRVKSEQMKEYCNSLSKQLSPVIARWENSYGLLNQATSGDS